MELLTVFTPTFNRCELLTRCYESLRNQTSKDFRWIIIDDGSEDETEETVKKWIGSEKLFQIQYFYKPNGGLHTAYNAAIDLLETELAVCIDSDDFMPENAVETINSFWENNGADCYAGIIGLDYTEDGRVIGDPLPNQVSISLVDLALKKYRIRSGDRKLVVRSDLYKSVAPMKTFQGEKYFNPNYLHMEIAKKYQFLVLNKNLCFVDYQDNGMSSNIYKQYYSSPRSFAELRKQHLSYEGAPFWYRFKEYAHYTSSCLLAKRWCGLNDVDWPLLIISSPFGLALSLFIKWKNR